MSVWTVPERTPRATRSGRELRDVFASVPFPVWGAVEPAGLPRWLTDWETEPVRTEPVWVKLAHGTLPGPVVVVASMPASWSRPDVGMVLAIEAAIRDGATHTEIIARMDAVEPIASGETDLLVDGEPVRFQLARVPEQWQAWAQLSGRTLTVDATGLEPQDVRLETLADLGTYVRGHRRVVGPSDAERPWEPLRRAIDEAESDS